MVYSVCPTFLLSDHPYNLYITGNDIKQYKMISILFTFAYCLSETVRVIKDTDKEKGTSLTHHFRFP